MYALPRLMLCHDPQMETFSQARLWGLVAPICEMGEYHWFHREKVEVYMGELYNKGRYSTYGVRTEGGWQWLAINP